MKKLLALLLLAGSTAVGVSAQTGIEPGLPIRPGHPSPGVGGPVNSPEPLTIVALAGGAAIAGGLVRARARRR